MKYNVRKRAQTARDMGLYYCEVCDKMMTAGQKGSHDKTVEHEANLSGQRN